MLVIQRRISPGRRLKYTGFCPMLPLHFGESYGKATRQILRERPQDLLKDRLSNVRCRKFPKARGDHTADSSGHPDSHKETDRCRCVNDSGGQCVGRHSNGHSSGCRCEQKESKPTTRTPRDGCGQAHPAYIFVEAYADSDCCSHKDHRSRKSSPPPKPEPRQVPVLAQHCHYPLFIAAPCQAVIADPYCPKREESCCGSQPSNYRQQSSCSHKQPRQGSCCDSFGTSHRQKASDRTCCGEYDNNQTRTQGRTSKPHAFRQCGVIPKYTGHITGMKFTNGESYGPSANRLLRKHHDKMKARNIYYR